ncbi:coatamer beta subunit, putative [Bodo saltans]|uniref:Coatomer subunit beta n=1 Tax=Bodo saltans TaxID=75058 RepID=A0A0S4J6I0_BODSA|nr:coatamer beta subunit, putative [Bodo saltans]|eukprot:CUG86806.1 coatamer beta subunit, putative [Bodo saltans]
MSTQEAQSTVLIAYEGASVTSKELKENLEKGDVATKTAALKKMILLQLNGEPQGQLIMTVIKNLVPLEDHAVKKLLLYFWEVVDKSDSNGNLLPEIILLCSFLRSDLQHPNEYIRGVTLRFLSKLKERDILEPLISSVVANLSHRVTYVRRSAVLAVHAIFAKFPQLLPDAPEMVEKFLLEENDVSARRNAFNMLFQCSQERATRFLASFRESNDMSQAGDVFQLSIVEFVKHMIQVNPFEKAKYVPILFAVLQSKSPAVLYQCASTLLTLSSSPTAIRHAANTFIHLLTTHSDNNVRLIVLERLNEMKGLFNDILQESLMDILRGLATGNVDIRREIIQLALDLVNHKNIDSFVQFMKKELVRSQSEDEMGDAAAQQEYRQLIVKGIHKTVMKHTSVAASVVPVLMDYICEPGASSYDVIIFIREVMQSQSELRADLLSRMSNSFQMISSPKVMRAVLWLFGVHCKSAEHITSIFDQLKQSLNPLPLAAAVTSAQTIEDDGPSTVATTTVREDGTYVMNIVLADKRKEAERSDLTGVRSQIVAGDFFLAAAFANTLAKLVVQLFKLPISPSVRHSVQSDAIALMQEIIRFGTSKSSPTPLDDDAHERLRLAITVAQNPHNDFLVSIVDDSYEAYSSVHAVSSEEESKETHVQQLTRADQPITFTQLNRGRNAVLEFEATADEVGVAVANESIEKDENFLGKLQRALPLSGFNDPVYVEATVTVHQFDILIEWLLVNQTSETLNNLTVELAALNDMKLCERPQSHTLLPHATLLTRSSLKVSSTESGVIFGTVLYDSAGSDRSCVLLNEIHVDIMDYIKPATCQLSDFRTMWNVFDWENKIVVNTDLTDLREFVERIVVETNMRPLDPIPHGNCDYLSSSLYARSVFGEDALANVSLELNEDGKIEGVVRIRSKTQAIALGLGEKVSSRQKCTENRK